MIALGLIRVGPREARQGLVERVARPKVAGNCRGVASLGVRPRHYPTTVARIGLELRRGKTIEIDRDLHVSQLSEIEVQGRLANLRPAQKQIAGRLHQTLPHDHPFALVSIRALSDVWCEYRFPRLFDLQEDVIVGIGRQNAENSTL